MKRLILSAILAFSFVTTQATSMHSIKTEIVISVGKVIGTVIGPDALPIPYASVELLDEHGKLIDGVLTEGDGTFALNNQNFGKYTLKITVAGGTAYEQVVNINSDTMDLGQITLSDQVIQLGTTETRGEVSKIRTEIDKRVIDIGKDLVSAGATAGEMLNNIPSDFFPPFREVL